MSVNVGQSYWELDDAAKEIYWVLRNAQATTCRSAAFLGHGMEDFFSELRNVDSDERRELVVFTGYAMYSNVGYYCNKHLMQAIYEKELGSEYRDYVSEEMFLKVLKVGSNFSPMPISIAMGLTMGPIAGLIGQFFESKIIGGVQPAHQEEREALENELMERMKEIGERYRNNCRASMSDALPAYNAMKADGYL